MKHSLKALAFVGALLVAGTAGAEVTFYGQPDFHGRSFTADRPVRNFERFGFNDRASSVVVRHGRWEVCEDARFEGRCVTLRPGNYPNLAAMGLNNRVSSVRPAHGHRDERQAYYDRDRHDYDRRDYRDSYHDRRW